MNAVFQISETCALETVHSNQTFKRLAIHMHSLTPYTIRFLCFLLIALCHASLWAQSTHPIFEHLTTEDGLSSDKVSDVIQDREGFYWISTQNGLNRFDGTSFQIFRNDPEDSTSLSHNNCSALLEDLNGDIWVGTYAGVSRFSKDKGSFQQIYLDHPAQIPDIANRINGLAMDAEGNIWISSFGLWKYDIRTDSVILFRHDTHSPSSIFEDSYISEVTYDSINNGIWNASANAIQFYDIAQSQFYHARHNPLGWKIFDTEPVGEVVQDHHNQIWFIDHKTAELLSFNLRKNSINHSGKKMHFGLRRINVDDQNRLWIFYWLASSEIYDPSSGKTNTGFFHPGHDKSILSDKATSVFVDQDNNYWIPSANGISIYTPENQYFELYQINISEKGYENDNFTIRGIAQTDSHTLWLATNVGLYEFDIQSATWQHIKTTPPLSRIATIAANGNTLWIGHATEVHVFDTKQKKITKTFPVEQNIFYITKGVEQEAWIGIWRGGVYNIDPVTNEISHFVVDSNDANSLRTNSTISAYFDDASLWIGYNLGKGFSRYDFTEKTFTHYNPADIIPSQANAGIITAIDKDISGALWLGTHGAGLIKWDLAHNTHVHFRQTDGLKSNFINSILPDQKGNAWISTADGINFYNSEQQSIHSPGISFVLPSGDHVANGLKGIDGYLYFFRPTEIIRINPASYKPDSRFPKLLISGFKVFDKAYNIHNAERLELDYDQNFFSFEFSSIRINPEKKVSYAYQLEGFDRDWNYPQSGNIASYTNIPGGKYTFLVKATNEQGQWSDPLIRLPVIIRPPFWKTWWFICIMALLFLGALYLAHLYRLAHVKKILLVRTKISQDLHDDIGGSLSSIYIYSSVAEKEVTENPVKAKEFLRKINTNSLQMMDDISDIVWANNPSSVHESTLEGRIKNYGYELLAQKNIECEYVIDPHIDSRLSSPEARRNIVLIIKEACNNMAKYSGATRARIAVTQFGSSLLLIIEDNGEGFEMESGRQGNGITTMTQRAASLGGQFTLKSVPGSGTKITCMIPLARISD